MRRNILVLLTLLLTSPMPLLAQGSAAWVGDPPSSGGIGWIVVTGADTRPDGSLEGAPLVFERAADGRWLALAPVPVGAAKSVTLDVTLDGGAARYRLPVRARSFPSERLSVDPRFTRPPDSALAVRIARERGLSAALGPTALATPRLWDSAFVAPRASAVTSGFGIARMFNGEVRSRHLGTDFQGAVGDPVRVANRGVVALVGDFYYSGRIVYVNHGDGLITAYLHMSRVLVAEGDTVERGQVIGNVGQSGRVTGPHLHWAVRHGERLVDGLSLLALPPPPETHTTSR
jgi:murein DD-endopeptidase MepM/ murein hydrolase activator NlpD